MSITKIRELFSLPNVHYADISTKYFPSLTLLKENIPTLSVTVPEINRESDACLRITLQYSMDVLPEVTFPKRFCPWVVKPKAKKKRKNRDREEKGLFCMIFSVKETED